MAESTLSITLSDLRANVQRAMSYGSYSATFSGLSSDYQAEINSIISRGLRQFYFPPPLPGEGQSHQWSFLRRPYYMTLNAPSVPTDTVTVASGVGTMSGGTLASWIAGGVVRFNGVGAFYNIASRDSATQFTLEDTTVTVAAGSSLAFYDHIQSLPDDFGGLDSPVTYEAGTDREALIQTNDARLRMMAQTGSRQVGPPSYCAVRTRTWPTGSATGQRDEIMFWPFPDTTYAVTFAYKILPGALTDPAYVPLGGASHGETILASCLAIAEEYSAVPLTRYRDQLFPQRLAASVLRDRGNLGVNLGTNTDRSDESDRHGYPWQYRNPTTIYSP